MKKTFTLHASLSWEEWQAVSKGHVQLVLDDSSWQAIDKAHAFVLSVAQSGTKAIYGINTGFGALCNVPVSQNDLTSLQLNLLRSHACGSGPEVRPEMIRLMLVTKVLSLSKGLSGVSRQTVQRLLDFYNYDVLPVVFEQGSLGASGDLAPLSHLCLPLVGEAEVRWKGGVYPSAQVLEKFQWSPLSLGPKEGLALINGTQFMLAHALQLVLEGFSIGFWADACAALSLEAFDGRLEPFDSRIQSARPQPGQAWSAKRVREWVEGSAGPLRAKEHVQDPYSFRCVPQVHGASLDALTYLSQVVINELNSATDNPMVFAEEEEVLSAGNFHGQPLALALDFAAIALAEWASISERRLYQLVNGKRGLPAFLTPDPGLHSGFMIVQYNAASVVSQNKQLCTPASVDSIESSAGQEDHVSMGANAATKALKVADNVWHVLGCEWMAAAQALHLRQWSTSPLLEDILLAYRAWVVPLAQDRYMAPDMAASVEFLRSVALDDATIYPTRS